MMERVSKYLLARTAAHPARAAAMATWVSQALNVGIQVALVPVLLQALGTERVGVWFYLLGWAAVLPLVDFGVSSTVARQIAYSGAGAREPGGPRTGDFIHARGTRAIARVLACQRWFTGRINVITFLLGVVLERAVIFQGAVQAGWDAHVCWYLLVAQAMALNHGRIPGALLSGLLRPALDRIGTGLGILLQNALLVAGILLAPTLTTAGAAFVVGALVQFAVLNGFAKSCFAGQPVGHPHPAMLRQLWRLCWRQGAASGAAFGMYQTNALLVGNALGPVLVATMAIPIRIATLLDDAIRAVFMPRIYFITNFLGQGNITGVFAVFWRSLLLCAGAALAAYGGFAWLGEDVIRVWTGGRLPSSSTFMLLLSAVHVMILLECILACFVTAHGVAPFAGMAWLGAAANIGLTLWLAPRYGIEGAAAAMLAAPLLTSFWFTVYWAWRLAAGHVRARGRAVLVAGFREAVGLAGGRSTR